MENIGFSEDTTQAPGVLVLQVAAITPSEYLNHYFIVLALQVACDLPLRGCHAILMIAYFFAIHKQVHCRADSFKHNEASWLSRLDFELHSVDPTFVGFIWYLRRISREWMNHVRVSRHSNAFHLPARWCFYRFIVINVLTILAELGFRVRVEELEVPSVQR